MGDKMYNQMNKCELYPSLRSTEYYRTPEPCPSLQSQRAEHAADKLNASLPNQSDLISLPRIQPPRTTGMRNQRNSYFS